MNLYTILFHSKNKTLQILALQIMYRASLTYQINKIDLRMNIECNMLFDYPFDIFKKLDIFRKLHFFCLKILIFS